MNPCKICIVRACCTQECIAYRVFKDLASTILTFISLLLSTVFVGYFTFYLLEVYPNKEHAREILKWMWITCIIYNITFSKYNLGKKGSIMFEILCGPFCTAIYTFMFIGAKIIKRV